MLLSLTSPHFPSKSLKPLKPTPIRCSLSQPAATRKPKPKPKPETLPKSAIQRISEKLRSLGFAEPDPPPPSGPGSAGEIFIPTPGELPRYRVGHTIDASWSTPENPVPSPGSGVAVAGLGRLWRREKEEEEKERRRRMEELPMAAELVLEEEELRRLRRDGIRLEKRLKVGKAGITEGIVNGIHERWRRSELVKIKCEDLCRMNMKRTHEILERKTGGLVVWRSGTIIILYRGANYKYPYFTDGDQADCNLDNISAEPDTDGISNGQEGKTLSPFIVYPLGQSPNTSLEKADNSLSNFGNPLAKSTNTSRPSLVAGVGSPKKVRLQLPGEAQLGEEADRLLDGLGPRFTDWWGYEPLPVDADLLPGIVHGFRRPFRLLPFGIKPKLTDREMTILRRLSRPLPCHFALGKNRNLQGLALSIVKLWERCEVVKIAIKRGVQNTNSEIMVEELKKLTGGTLLSRDREFIVFYRGKDFLPPAVSNAIEERRNSETGRQKQRPSVISDKENIASSPLCVGRPASVNNIQEETYNENLHIKGRGKVANLAIKRVETKLSQALEKKEKAEKLLAELEKPKEPLLVEADKEGITEEERYMLRKVGLRMKPFLLLGRRGVFAGTVENMHLHWKYRELVKIISKDRSIEHVEIAARTLEAESGGILVAVERVNKGHAIIVYRGKNYRRPATLRPMTLLNKKEAMKRSLEAQRRESLKLHVLSLSRNIEKLEDQMLVKNDQSAVDTKRLTEYEKSSSGDEMNKWDGSVGRHSSSSEFAHHQDNIEAEGHPTIYKMLLTECERSDTMDTVNEEGESTERGDSEVSTYSESE
ncbi:CRM-domain containing factor CFM2, chloroplastic isoform X1 [Iris pallida]|uniref:CRM-domain containing factor CFM3, chloroplastic/mitochondrial n=1 Tax=Iris pallida TaxID=29817 RepID=A0AAX6GS08_IRIPA|nr:CRM-domain containing factor CFM2, chloroplastic isoform X1 [Iris pallida]